MFCGTASAPVTSADSRQSHNARLAGEAAFEEDDGVDFPWFGDKAAFAEDDRFYKREHQQDTLQRMIDWFDKYLKGER